MFNQMFHNAQNARIRQEVEQLKQMYDSNPQQLSHLKE
jgi:hypothetical protein